LITNAAQTPNSVEKSVPPEMRQGLTGLGRGARLLEKKRRREEDNARANSRKVYKEAWEELKEETFPTRPEEMEQFFMTQISRGEQLAQDPGNRTQL
jgi:MAS20 protein import receptor